MGNQVGDNLDIDSRWRSLYKVTGTAALMAGVLLLIGMPSPITAFLPSGGTSSWLPALQDNWLIVIFKLHAGFNGAQIGLLKVPSLLDIGILALVGIMYLGLYGALRRTSRIWSLVAAMQPFLGIVLFMATNSAGRSAAMGAGLVISLVMLRSGIFNRSIAYLGIAASVFLLIGDFSAGIPPSAIIAILFGMAYVLFIVWLFLIGQRLFQLGRGGATQ
jgi:hypothetical protein